MTTCRHRILANGLDVFHNCHQITILETQVSSFIRLDVFVHSSVATAFRPFKTDVWQYSENSVLPQGFHLFCTRTLLYKLQTRARREIWRTRPMLV